LDAKFSTLGANKNCALELELMMIELMMMMMMMMKARTNRSVIQSQLHERCHMHDEQALFRHTHPTFNACQIIIIFWILGQPSSELYAV